MTLEKDCTVVNLRLHSNWKTSARDTGKTLKDDDLITKWPLSIKSRTNLAKRKFPANKKNHRKKSYQTAENKSNILTNLLAIGQLSKNWVVLSKQFENKLKKNIFLSSLNYHSDVWWFFKVWQDICLDLFWAIIYQIFWEKRRNFFCPKILYTRPVHQNLFGHTYIPAQIWIKCCRNRSWGPICESCCKNLLLAAVAKCTGVMLTWMLGLVSIRYWM